MDLRSNIAAEARAKIVYERLINFCDDAGTKDALQFLMTREITHMKAFAAALESMKKPAFSIGKIAPTPGLVNQFFNDSTGSVFLMSSGERNPPLTCIIRATVNHDIMTAFKIMIQAAIA